MDTVKYCNCSIREGIHGGRCLTCGNEVGESPVIPENIPDIEDTPVDERAILESAKIMNDMGPVEEKSQLPDPTSRIIDGSSKMKCACDKVVDALDMPRRHSGVIPYIDNICPGCEEQAKGLSPVVCSSCHRVCGRLKPFTDENGFKVEAGKTYHITECPMCQPDKFKSGMRRSPIVEMVIYYKKKGLETN